MPTNAVPAVTDFSPITLFMQADIVVKVIMLGLMAASIWTWAIIVAQILKNRRAHAASDQFEAEIKEAGITSESTKHLGRESSPAAALFKAAMTEWTKSVRAKASLDKDAARERIADVLEGAIEGEVDRLSERLNYLATIGSIAPFVGLFGTVWGIMRSFTSIAASQNTSLSVVAPGIAEALLATAIGLFAAIPAVIAYNRFGHGVNRFEARLVRFARYLRGNLSRELDAL
jgi:biopolymer transport protein TolQ